MKRAVAIIVSLCLSFAGRAQELGAERLLQIDAMMEEYTAALAGEPVEVKKAECDRMIAACADSLVRQYVALQLYDRYFESPVMGDEAVAVHLADRWILSGEVKVREPMDLTYIRIFTEFNRSSLIGLPAPFLELRDAEGQAERLFDGRDAEKYRILYFYSPDCAVCKLLSAQLKTLLEARNYPLEVVAVYTGQDAEAWRAYRSDQLDIHAYNVKVRHFWDPDIDSDYQRKYGVIQTPMLLLIDPSGTIAGRKLDAGALALLLKEAFEEMEYDYGSDDSRKMYAEVFPAEVKAADILEVAEYIASQTIAAGDTAGFKHLAGDMLYYLAGRKGEECKLGTERLIDEYILRDNGIWTTKEDTLKVIGLAQMLKSLMQLAPVGGEIPDLKVPGVLRHRTASSAGVYPLRYIRGNPTLIVFYVPGCASCEETLASAAALVQADRGLKALLVNMDEIEEQDPSLAGSLVESFDLSVLPFVIQMDYKGIVERKYIDLTR